MMQKVLLILADGFRPDALAACGHPFAGRLLTLGSYSLRARTVWPSVTLPCHMSLFHSVAPDRHGILTNTYVPQVRPVNGLCEQLHAAGKTCAFFYDWEELRDLSRPGSLAYSYFVSGSQNTYEAADEAITENALRVLAEQAPDFAFVYLGAPDEVGHRHGWMGEEYLASCRLALSQAQKLIDRFSGTYTVLFTADHGGHDRTHGAQDDSDMLIPLVCIGPDFSPGPMERIPSILDIAPTAARLIGAFPDRAWEGTSLANG